MIYCIIYKFFSIKGTIKGHKTDNKKTANFGCFKRNSFFILVPNARLTKSCPSCPYGFDLI
nr:MAG TPA: hypothetical protein [Caudoviricetes sp.]